MEKRLGTLTLGVRHLAIAHLMKKRS